MGDSKAKIRAQGRMGGVQRDRTDKISDFEEDSSDELIKDEGQEADIYPVTYPQQRISTFEMYTETGCTPTMLRNSMGDCG